MFEHKKIIPVLFRLFQLYFWNIVAISRKYLLCNPSMNEPKPLDKAFYWTMSKTQAKIPSKLTHLLD